MNRFFARIERIPEHSCHEWIGYKDKDGYGTLSAVVNGKKKTLKAHRISYEYHIGPVPKGMCVCHQCDNRPCVNPKHLFLDTVSGNNKDRSRKGRTRGLNLKFCSKGHEYDLVNTYVRPDGTGRDCKKCKKTANDKWYARSKTL